MPLILEPQIAKLNYNAKVYNCIVNFPNGEIVNRTYRFMGRPDLTEIASDFPPCVHVRRNSYYYLKSTTQYYRMYGWLSTGFRTGYWIY
jgi:hypothetical protein